MREVVFKTDLKFEEIKVALGKSLNFDRREYLEYSKRPDYVVYLDPSIFILRADMEKARTLNRNVVIVVIAKSYKGELYEAAFSDIKVIHYDERFIKSDLRSALSSHSVDDRRRCAFTLSEREKRYLSEYVMGPSSALMADRLCISERTLRRLKSNLMARLGLTSSLELMAFAYLSEEVRTHSISRLLDRG